MTALFAMHQRVRPFNKFLGWELRSYPLGEESWSAAALLPRLETIMADGALDEQQRLFRDVERLARERGLGEVVDGWQPDLEWLRRPGEGVSDLLAWCPVLVGSRVLGAGGGRGIDR